jgi:hypothetical protein
MQTLQSGVSIAKVTCSCPEYTSHYRIIGLGYHDLGFDKAEYAIQPQFA